jgi:hypothetical protein
MEQQDDQRRRPRWTRGRTGAVAVIGVGVIGPGVLAGVIWLIPDRAAGRPVELLQLQPVHRPNRHFMTADSTWLPDDAPVIGVTARSQAQSVRDRARSSNIGEHVVNDRRGPAYQSPWPTAIERTARRFTRVPPDDRALDVAVGGWVGEPGSSANGVLLLRVDSNYYLQDTGEQLSGWSHFPYPEAAFERTTWGQWRRAHPDTDVVTGPRHNIEVEQ